MPPPHAPALTGYPGWLVLLGLLTALGPLAIDLYLPAFPAIAQSLHTTPGHVERTLAAYLLGLAVAQLFYGPLADRYGRRLPMLLGLCLFTIASVGCALASDIQQLTLWRVVQSCGGAAGMVVTRAVIRDRLGTRDAAKALSLLMLVMGVTPILAPIVGGQVLMLADWRWLFAIISACSAALLAAVVWGMPETLDPARRQPLAPSSILRNYRALLRHRGFMGYALAGAFGSAGMFSYIAGSPRAFIEVYQIDPRWFGVLFGLNAASLIVASQASARLLNRYTPEVLLRRAQLTFVIFSAAGLALALAGVMTLPLLMLCLLGFMAPQGFVNPNSAALALAEQGGRLGVASALMGTLSMLAGATAGFAVSAWQSPSALPLVSLLAICSLLSWICGRYAAKPSA